MTDVDLAAVLIVRDEADTLPGCLASLGGAVDAVHVHDTGSVDGTPDIARALGATVSRAPWPDDFAAARNAALDASGARDWVLSIDADERLVAGPGRLRELLTQPPDAFAVEVDNRHDELPYTHRPVRLFRPARLRWTGRVHERLPGAWPAAPRDVVHLVHEGYADPDTRRRKALRNAELARKTLSSEPSAEALLDLGRSLVGAGQLQGGRRHVRAAARDGPRHPAVGPRHRRPGPAAARRRDRRRGGRTVAATANRRGGGAVL